MDLVGDAGTWPLWDQSRNPRSIEVRLGLVVGWPGNAILVGNLGHRGVLDGDLSYLTCTASRGSKNSLS